MHISNQRKVRVQPKGVSWTTVRKETLIRRKRRRKNTAKGGMPSGPKRPRSVRLANLANTGVRGPATRGKEISLMKIAKRRKYRRWKLLEKLIDEIKPFHSIRKHNYVFEKDLNTITVGLSTAVDNAFSIHKAFSFQKKTLRVAVLSEIQDTLEWLSKKLRDKRSDIDATVAVRLIDILKRLPFQFVSSDKPAADIIIRRLSQTLKEKSVDNRYLSRKELRRGKTFKEVLDIFEEIIHTNRLSETVFETITLNLALLTKYEPVVDRARNFIAKEGDYNSQYDPDRFNTFKRLISWLNKTLKTRCDFLDTVAFNKPVTDALIDRIMTIHQNLFRFSIDFVPVMSLLEDNSSENMTPIVAYYSRPDKLRVHRLLGPESRGDLRFRDQRLSSIAKEFNRWARSKGRVSESVLKTITRRLKLFIRIDRNIYAHLNPGSRGYIVRSVKNMFKSLYNKLDDETLTFDATVTNPLIDIIENKLSQYYVGGSFYRSIILPLCRKLRDRTINRTLKKRKRGFSRKT